MALFPVSHGGGGSQILKQSLEEGSQKGSQKGLGFQSCLDALLESYDPLGVCPSSIHSRCVCVCVCVCVCLCDRVCVSV